MAHSPIEVIQGDILSHDWFDADLIYLNAIFSPEFLEQVADLSSNLKKGARLIVQFKTLPERAHLLLFASIEVTMSWGLGRVFYYKTI